MNIWDIYYQYNTEKDVPALFCAYIRARHNDTISLWLDRYPYGITIERVVFTPYWMQRKLDEDVRNLTRRYCMEKAKQLGVQTHPDVENVIMKFAGVYQGKFKWLGCIVPTPPLTPFTTDSEGSNDEYDYQLEDDYEEDIDTIHSRISFNLEDIDRPRPKVKKISIRL